MHNMHKMHNVYNNAKHNRNIDKNIELYLESTSNCYINIQQGYNKYIVIIACCPKSIPFVFVTRGCITGYYHSST